MRIFLQIYDNEVLNKTIYYDNILIEISYLCRIYNEYEYVDVRIEEMETFQPTIDDFCFGTVEFTTRFFELIGVKIPSSITYPPTLVDYLKRGIYELTYGEFKASDVDLPVFIKPSTNVKAFTGTVIVNKDSLRFIECSDSELIYVSSVVDIISEYRAFISNKKVYGLKHYLGDFSAFPSISVLNEMVNSYVDAPSAYTLDIGILSSGETVLIEVNDMWAIGHYGLSPDKFKLLSLRRMTEIKRM